jgi:hypothetical protein
MKLLTEYNIFEYTSEMIKESIEENNGKVVMRGVLQKANTLNQNGRVYPLPILQREIMNYQKFIREGRSLGELDHPDSSVVELKNVSHIVRDATMDGDSVIGTVEILNTPSGKILQSLIESGVTLGISSRGVGTTKRQGDTQVVQDDFQLICWDFVSEPSTPGAFMMSEGRDLSPEEIKNIFTKTDRIDRILNEMLGDE